MDFSLPTTAATGRAVLQGMVGLIDGHVFSVLEGGQAMAAPWAADQMVKRPPGNKLHRHGEQQGEPHGRGKRDEPQPGQPAGKQQTPDQYHRAEFGQVGDPGFTKHDEMIHGRVSDWPARQRM